MNFRGKMQFSQIANDLKIKSEVLELFFSYKTYTLQVFKDYLLLNVRFEIMLLLKATSL